MDIKAQLALLKRGALSLVSEEELAKKLAPSFGRFRI
jgi:hypothetical protein